MGDDDTWTSIPAMLRDTAGSRPTTEAIVSGGTRITYGELEAAVNRAARGLLACGIAPGDRVAIWAPNSTEWIVAALAITTAGGVLVPVNTRFKGAEAADVVPIEAGKAAKKGRAARRRKSAASSRAARRSSAESAFQRGQSIWRKS